MSAYWGGFGAIPAAMIGGTIEGWAGSEAGEATALEMVHPINRLNLT